MAGSYDDVPSRRMAIDADGSVIAAYNKSNGSPVAELNSSQRTSLNDEAGSTVSIVGGVGIAGGESFHDWRGIIIFPELREFDGFFAKAGANTNSASYLTTVETSGDSTNGVDGSWTTQTANLLDPAQTSPQYRNSITSFAASSVRAVRLERSGGDGGGALWNAAHVYGDITPGQTLDRLLFIDEATGLEYTASRDYGDIPRGGSEDSEWRIKNNSASLTATTIQYTTEALTLGSGAWYTHTLPGGSTYQSTRQVASLAPATTTGIIKTRRITPGGTTLGLHAGRTYLNVDTWS